MGDQKTILIPHGTLQQGRNNVIDIPEEYDESRVLIARLRAQTARPPGYYPPRTNPANQFERRIGDHVVGLGVPPLSPLREEHSSYETSFEQYGRTPPQPTRPPGAGSPRSQPRGLPRPTPIYSPGVYTPPEQRARPRPAPAYSPGADSMDDVNVSCLVNGPTPPRRFMRVPGGVLSALSPPPRSPVDSPYESSVSTADLSALISPSPERIRRRPPCILPPPRSPLPQEILQPGYRTSASPGDSSVGSDELSLLISPSPSPPSPPRRRRRPPPPPQSPLSFSSDVSFTEEDINILMEFEEQLNQNSNLNRPLHELDEVELQEFRILRERMRTFQDARRQLVVSVMSLQESEVPEVVDV